MSVGHGGGGRGGEKRALCRCCRASMRACVRATSERILNNSFEVERRNEWEDMTSRREETESSLTHTHTQTQALRRFVCLSSRSSAVAASYDGASASLSLCLVVLSVPSSSAAMSLLIADVWGAPSFSSRHVFCPLSTEGGAACRPPSSLLVVFILLRRGFPSSPLSRSSPSPPCPSLLPSSSSAPPFLASPSSRKIEQLER